MTEIYPGKAVYHSLDHHVRVQKSDHMSLDMYLLNRESHNSEIYVKIQKEILSSYRTYN